MKAKDLTQADVGKWVTLRGKIRDVGRENVKIEFENEDCWSTVLFDTTIEFTDPPAPVHEVGDVFKNLGTHSAEWTVSMIDGDACLMRYLTGHVSADYPLNPDLWEFVRKGAAS
jgi:hypothetical protein